MEKSAVNIIIINIVIIKPESRFLVLDVVKNRPLSFSIDLPIQTTG